MAARDALAAARAKAAAADRNFASAQKEMAKQQAAHAAALAEQQKLDPQLASRQLAWSR